MSLLYQYVNALEILKNGGLVTNTNYNPNFRIKLSNNKFILTNFTKAYSDQFGNIRYVAIDGLPAIYVELDSIDIDDILNEEWYIYG